MSDKIDCKNTIEAVCPYCGKVQDTWELFTEMEETIETECGTCEKPFTLTRTVIFYYDSYKKDEDKK